MVKDACFDREIRSHLKSLCTQGTPAEEPAVPVASDAGLAEVVSAESRHWMNEYIQTDGTPELLFGTESAAGSHI